MAPLILFAFGPDDSFWFNCGSDWKEHRAHWSFREIVLPNFATLYHVCLGPAENEYCTFYEDSESKLRYAINFPFTTSLDHLHVWFPDQINTKGGIGLYRCSIGPGDTYVALTCQEHRWGPEDAIPPALAAILRDADQTKRRIAEVALGCGGAWWLKWADGECRWALGGKYEGLEKLLREMEVLPRDINSLVLSPYNPQHYFLVYQSNKVHFALPALFAQMIGPVLKKYHASLQTVIAHFDGTKKEATEYSHTLSHLPPPYTRAEPESAGAHAATEPGAVPEVQRENVAEGVNLGEDQQAADEERTDLQGEGDQEVESAHQEYVHSTVEVQADGEHSDKPERLP